ncbi:MAG: hypothetical protein J0L72_08010 [Armatimonadetes bacterium]|nr:hypothetical protein [Armatimonadota bacterium]
MKVLTLLFKWLVVPLAFAMVGYVFIGPHIGQPTPAALKALQDKVSGSAPEAAATSDVKPSGNEQNFEKPSVTTEVTHVNGRKVDEKSAKRTTEENEPAVTENNGETETTPTEGAPAEGEGTTREPSTDPDPAPNTPETLPDGPQ